MIKYLTVTKIVKDCKIGAREEDEKFETTEEIAEFVQNFMVQNIVDVQSMKVKSQRTKRYLSSSSCNWYFGRSSESNRNVFINDITQGHLS